MICSADALLLSPWSPPCQHRSPPMVQCRLPRRYRPATICSADTLPSPAPQAPSLPLRVALKPSLQCQKTIQKYKRAVPDFKTSEYTVKIFADMLSSYKCNHMS